MPIQLGMLISLLKSTNYRIYVLRLAGSNLSGFSKGSRCETC